MTAAPSVGQAVVQLEALGTVLVLDEARRVVHASQRCASLLGTAPDELVGGALSDAVGDQADLILQDVVSAGMDRAGGWWPVVLPGGRSAKLRAFSAGAGLVGVDVLPVDAAGAAAADADSIERIAGWNDWLLACSSSADLLEVAASVTRERLGFDGVWVYRVEGDGRSVVAASSGAGPAADLVGHSVPASDVPPSQPRLRGRAVPFFVADLAAAGCGLVPGSAALDLDGSALLRPFPEYLERLLSLGVRSTASLPIIVDGRLWGRVIAHHPAARRVAAATQSELRLLAAAASARLAELIEQEDAREQVELARYSLRLMSYVAGSTDLVDGLTLDAADLAGVCAADGAIVAVGGRVAASGLTADPATIGALIEVARAALASTIGSAITASSTLGSDVEVDPAVAAGFLAIRLGRTVDDVVIWVRRENPRAVTWVEHEVVDDALAGELFSGAVRRQERSRGACAPWTAAQHAQADELREAIGQVQIARYGQVQSLNSELARSNEEYDAFAHAAAHDLKQPLRGIRQNTEFFLEDTAGQLDPEVTAQLQTVVRLSANMNVMLDDLMAYAQVGKAPWDPRPIDIELAVADALELLGSRVARATVHVEPGSFTSDASALRQILLNLLGNAAKYSEGPAEITVAVTTLQDVDSAPAALVARAPVGTQVLTIADRGIGIDPAFHERVFGLFQQLDRQSDGTGTGLALCRLICRRHGGDIWPVPTPGGGTTFHVATTV